VIGVIGVDDVISVKDEEEEDISVKSG